MSRLAEICKTEWTAAKAKSKEKWNQFVDLCIDTPAEIVLGAALVASMATCGAHAREHNRSLYQPASFSEYEQVENEFIRAQGREPVNSELHGPLEISNQLTAFYSSVNDFNAKIFEAYNFNSWLGNFPPLHRQWFAQKLDQAMDTTGRMYRRNIRDFAKIIPVHARGSLNELTDLRTASAHSRKLSALFDETWSYDRTESGHYETHESCSTDSKGNTSCTTYTVYVCDNYHHTWSFHPIASRQTVQAFEQAAQAVPTVQRMQIATATKTDAWNEQVIREAFRRKFNREPNNQEMLERALYFKKGSQYERNIDPARTEWQTAINSDRQTWKKYHVSSARDPIRTMTTGCHSVSGPVEFEFAEQMQEKFNDIVEREQAITQPINNAIHQAPALERDIMKFILTVKPHWTAHYPEIKQEELKKSEAKTASLVIGEARDMYKSNIPNGNEVTNYRTGVVFLASIVGSLIGAGLGMLADQAVAKYIAPSRRRRNRFYYNY